MFKLKNIVEIKKTFLINSYINFIFEYIDIFYTKRWGSSAKPIPISIRSRFFGVKETWMHVINYNQINYKTWKS